jgi:hypothetical protein
MIFIFLHFRLHVLDRFLIGLNGLAAAALMNFVFMAALLDFKAA